MAICFMAKKYDTKHIKTPFPYDNFSTKIATATSGCFMRGALERGLKPKVSKTQCLVALFKGHIYGSFSVAL